MPPFIVMVSAPEPAITADAEAATGAVEVICCIFANVTFVRLYVLGCALAAAVAVATVLAELVAVRELIVERSLMPDSALDSDEILP